MENYENIYYANCPHFTVGRGDQWSENGYLLFEGTVYRYEEDRKEQCGTTTLPMSIEQFLDYADQQQIEVPDDFLNKLRKSLENDKTK